MDQEEIGIPSPGLPEPFEVVVSGIPRSGTSLCMLCFSKAVGLDNIAGKKFPSEARIVLEKQDGESDARFNFRSYMHSRTVTQDDIDDVNFSKDMNPNGFWEDGRFSVRGIHYGPMLESFDGKVGKIVSSGLANTDPRYMKRVVYMLRNPHAVAKSWERVRRMPFMRAKEEAELEIHDPIGFIRGTYQAALWFLRNPEVPRLFVEFEELVADPDNTLARVGEFAGVDFKDHPINPKIQRSNKSEDRKEHRLFEYAMPLYYMMRREDFLGVVEFFRDNAVEIMKESSSTHCLRLGGRVPYNVCKICISGSSDFIRNKIVQAETKGIKWQDEPCVFECGGDPTLEDDEILTPEESIAENHWNDQDEEYPGS